MIIAIDWDNILNNFTEKILEVYNAQSGKNIKMKDLTSYDFYDCVAKEDADGIVKLFKNKAIWDSLVPIEGSREGLQKLIEAGHRCYIVTATAPDNFNWKIQWLKKYFPFFNTNNFTTSIGKFGTHTINFAIYLTNENLCNKILNIVNGVTENGVDNSFIFKIQYKNGQYVRKEYKLINYRRSQDVGQLPIITCSFTQ